MLMLSRNGKIIDMGTINRITSWFREVDNKIWGEKIDANKYFTTLSITVTALYGALIGGSRTLYSWFGWDFNIPNNVAILIILIMIYCGNVGESVVAAKKASVALWRSVMLLFVIAAAFVLGYLASVVAIVVIAVWLVFTALGVILSGRASNSSKKYILDNGDEVKESGSDLLGGGKYYKTNNGKEYKSEDEGRTFTEQ